VNRRQPNTTLSAFDLGIAPYLPTHEIQRQIQEGIVGGSHPGVLLLLEHPPVITLGSQGGVQDLLPAEGTPTPIPILHTERGGAATLHAPGQLVCYPLLPIPGRDLRRYVTALEEVLIRLLEDHGVTAHRRKGKPGVYVLDAKIASLGLRCRRWVAGHGTSLNATVDLSLFQYLISCGEKDLQQTSIQRESGHSPAMEDLKSGYLHHFREVFGIPTAPLEPIEHQDILRRLGLG